MVTLPDRPDIVPGAILIYASQDCEEQATETLLDVMAYLALERNLDLSEDWTISLVSNLSSPQWSALLAWIDTRLSLPHEDATILDLLSSHQLSAL